ncbi:MAG: hypothetical protein QM750_27935 [Rubrivivax sp.]
MQAAGDGNDAITVTTAVTGTSGLLIDVGDPAQLSPPDRALALASASAGSPRRSHCS